MAEEKIDRYIRLKNELADYVSYQLELKNDVKALEREIRRTGIVIDELRRELTNE